MFRTYSAKMITAALIMAVLLQAFFLISGLINVKQVYSETENNLDNKYYQYLQDTVSTIFNDIYTLASILRTDRFLEYAEANWNLKDKNEADKIKERINHDINNLQLNPAVIKKIYLIGRDKNQRSFAKSINSVKWSDEEIPCYEDLERAHLENIIFKGTSIPSMIQIGELTEQLEKRSEKIDPSVYERLKTFSKQLEGNLVLCENNASLEYAYLGSFVITIIIIDPNFMDHFLFEYTKDKYITLQDKNGQIIWSNSKPDSKASEFFRTSMISPLNFQLTYSSKRDAVKEEMEKYLTIFVLVSSIILIITFLIVLLFSSILLKPFKHLRTLISQQCPSDSPYIVPLESQIKGMLSKTPVNKKIFMIFIVSVILPSIISGFIYTNFLYNNIRIKLDETIKKISHQTSHNLEMVMKSFNLQDSLIASEVLEEYIVNYKNSREYNNKEIDKHLVNQSFNLNSFQYYVLLDTSGSSIYQSIYGNFPELFKVSEDMLRNWYESNKNDTFWITVKKDIFNMPALVLVRKIYHTADRPNLQANVIGYFLTFFRQNIFQFVNLNSDYNFTLLDKDGTLIYQSITSSSNTKVDNSNSLIFKEPIPNSELVLITYQKYDYAMSKGNELVLKNVIITILATLLALLISWLLSRLIVEPIKSLKEDMIKVRNGCFDNPLKYDNQDEIGELIQTYNKMITQINSLIRENINRKVYEQELITLKTQAELNMLQQQINPHFLYNALEHINLQIMRTCDEKCSLMITALARLFRYSTSTTDKTVKLEQEIEHAKNYMTVQELRFQGKLASEWDIDESAMKHQVLKFTLQPILENAINHGLAEYSSGGIIKVSAKVKDDFIIVKISDNGVGMDNSALEGLLNSLESSEESSKNAIPDSGGTGIGLKNVYKRLRIFYNNKASMTIESQFMKGTTVKIVFPIITSE